MGTVHILPRWLGFAVCLALYGLRVYIIQGWFLITYGLGIFLLNNFIGFLSPQLDPETDGATLPIAGGDAEFRPFNRRVPEFKFWHSSMKAIVFAFFATFFEVFNIPVFWPILLLYFIALFFLTMKRQIKHMWKHKYVPWSAGKTVYKGKQPAGKDSK